MAKPTGTFINLVSNKLVGRDVIFALDDSGELKVELNDRLAMAAISTIFCVLIYGSSFVFFTLASKTFR